MAVVSMVPKTLAQFSKATPQDAQAWIEQNGPFIASVIDKHKTWLEGIVKFQQAYDGQLEEIEARDKERGDEVNNKIQVNYAQLVIDTVVDYMLGKPPVWTVEDTEADGEGKADKALLDEYRKAIIGLLQTEEAQRVLAEQLRQGSIGGYSPVIGWVDEAGNIDYDEFPINEVIPVYDSRGRLALAIRYYQAEIFEAGQAEGVTRTKVEVYDGRYVSYYLSNETGNGYTLDVNELPGNPIEHKAGRIPVSIFINGTPAQYHERVKRVGTSDLGNGVLTLLLAAAHSVSDKANTVDRLLDQYLLLTGVDVDEKEVVKMRKARALALKSKESSASFIAPSQEDTAVENFLNRLEEAIFTMTFTPKLNDLEGSTATEIKMKYASLDIKAGKKEIYFTAAVKQLIATITDMLNYRRLVDAGVDEESIYDILAGKVESSTQLYNPDWLQFTFKRNLPQNNKEIAEIVGLLADKVPDSYLYELLWFIDDPVAALAEMKAQREAKAKEAMTAIGYGGEFGGTGGDTGGTE